jgi:protein O-mannosyl-transferase
MRLPTLRQIGALPAAWMALALLATAIVYAQGLPGAFTFDDFPNIVDNTDLRVTRASVPDLLSAALSSPSSDFKRPLASLSFALNIIASGVDPAPMKITNIVIHLVNGLLVFLITRRLVARNPLQPDQRESGTAILVSLAWMVLPINLTAVLYVVQRMESLANVFVLLGLYGYILGRQRMLRSGYGRVTATTSLIACTALGLLAKETAVLTPLYAFLLELFVFHWRTAAREGSFRRSRFIIALFIAALLIPGIAGVLWVGPALMRASTWAPRDFTMSTRLLSEARIVLDYLAWTIFPTPTGLSFYHDDFRISTGLFAPAATLFSIAGLVGLAGAAILLRKRARLASLGIAWMLACHTLTGTVIPLELIYEHRNYFASIGVMLAVVTGLRGNVTTSVVVTGTVPTSSRVTVGNIVLAFAIVYWAVLTGFTAYRWRTPVGLAEELAARNPQSPRAQYELGRTYIIGSQYDASSPFVPLIPRQLERAAVLPGASTLPEQALIFFAARMHQPIKDAWWDSMEAKLHSKPPTIEDESAIFSLSTCSLKGMCTLPANRIVRLYLAALTHPDPRARLLAAYADFAWSGLRDTQLAFRLSKDASATMPSLPSIWQPWSS